MRVLERVANDFSTRNAFGIVLVIIAIHLIIMIVYLNDNRIARRAEKRDAVIQKIANVINLIYATPVENRKHAIAALTDPFLDASITGTPAWSLQFATVSYSQIREALKHQPGLFSISIELEPKQWLNIHATIYSHFLYKQLIFFIIEGVVFSVILTSLWMVGRFTKPFRHFKEMAERLGVDHNSKLIPINGPEVVKEATQAMNLMQSRIQEMIRDRTQMLAAISHDLRTPITRLRLRAQFIKDGEVSNSLLSDLSEMETMINETMAFARDDNSGEEKIQIDLVSLISSLCDGFIDLGHRIKFNSKQHRIAFLGRPVALKRAFNNLIGNAVRYAKHIEVKVYHRSKSILVLIKDDGPGIKEHDLERVFSPFYRAEQSRNRNTGGMGLGLAVTRDIIKSHGGKVSLANLRGGGLCAIVKFMNTSRPASYRL